MIRLLTWIILVLSLADTATASLHDRYIVYFPFVAKGILNGVSYETSIRVSNPGQDTVEVVLSSDLLDPDPFLPRVVFQLQPGATRKVNLSAEPFRMAWVRLESTDTVAATAHFLARQSGSSSEITSEINLEGRVPSSKVTIPVVRRGSASPPTTGADNLGVAIAVIQAGRIQLTVRDSQAMILASRTLRSSVVSAPSADFNSHLAKFLTDLVPDLPTDFTEGSLTVEYIEDNLPRAFAVEVIYLNGNALWSAAVTAVDIPAQYFFELKPTDNPLQKAQEMAAQYAFAIAKTFGDPKLFLVTMQDEVARAVARDPRTEDVSPNSFVEFTSQ